MNEQLPKILVVDDDPSLLLQMPFAFEGIAEITTADDLDAGIKKLSETYYDILLLDLNFEGDTRTGLDLFRLIPEIDSQVDVIVVSAETDPEKIVEVCNAGVTRFVPKHTGIERVRSEAVKVLNERIIRKRALDAQLRNSALDKLSGNSPAMVALKNEIIRIAKDGVKDILVLGETGTGKELVARAICELADPSNRFFPINCGALNDNLAESELFGHVKGAFTGATSERAGVFELARGGFVFLDEIGEMPLNQQVKLLRVLQQRAVTRVGSNSEKTCSFRTIAATHVDIDGAIKSKQFREDLYYRLNKAVIEIPALRNRREDIPEIVENLLANRKTDKTFSDSAMDILCSHTWPGNVRQLESVVETLISRSEERTIRDFEVVAVLKGGRQPTQTVKSFLGMKGLELANAERKRFMDALKSAQNDRNEAAKVLGISRATFFRRAKELGLTVAR